MEESEEDEEEDQIDPVSVNASSFNSESKLVIDNVEESSRNILQISDIFRDDDIP